jgi:hypothetical protein
LNFDFMCRFDPEVKARPERLPQGLLAWVWPVLSYDEDEIIRKAGMDAAVFIRLLYYGTVLAPVSSLSYPILALAAAGQCAEKCD